MRPKSAYCVNHASGNRVLKGLGLITSTLHVFIDVSLFYCFPCNTTSYRGITRRISEEDNSKMRIQYPHNTFCQDSSQHTDSIPIVSNVL